MQQSRREALDAFLQFVTEKNDTIAREIAGLALNRAVLAIWMKRAWVDFKASAPYEFSTIANQRSYVLPRHFGRVSTQNGRVRNLTTAHWLLPVMGEDLESIHPEVGTTRESAGEPDGYLLESTAGVTVQPDSAGELCEVISSDALDVDVRAYIEGLDDAGIYRRTEVTANGNAAVSVGLWSKIEVFGKSYPAGTTPATPQTTSRGTITLRTTAGATVLQTLLPDESALTLKILSVFPKPNGVYRIAVPYLRAPRTLYYDSDPLPALWGNAIFEELCITWLVNKGKIASDAQVARPHLADLIGLENSQAIDFKRHRRAFGSYR